MKSTYSKGYIWKPGATDTTKQIATVSKEVTAMKLIGSGGSAVVALYDTRNRETDDNHLRWVLDASTTYNDTQSFPNPLVFEKGIYAVLEQGVGTNPILCMAAIPTSV
jgi:hypothetical protein